MSPMGKFRSKRRKPFLKPQKMIKAWANLEKQSGGNKG